MRVFAIYDQDLDREIPIGYLFSYDKAGSFIIELSDDLTEWEAPLLFQSLVKRGEYTVPADISMLWVRERVIPSGRQNIGLILRNARLKEYNEANLLAISEGRCSQDQCYVIKISESEVPENISARMNTNVSECFMAADSRVICLFRDNTTCSVDLNILSEENRDIQKLLRKPELLTDVKVGVGGYSIEFPDYAEINKNVLREDRWRLPLSSQVFYKFVENNIMSSSQVCESMGCTKQNLSYFVNKNSLEPIIHGSRENFFTCGDVQKLKDS